MSAKQMMRLKRIDAQVLRYVIFVQDARVQVRVTKYHENIKTHVLDYT